MISTTFISIVVAYNGIGYVAYGVDTIVNSVCLMLSFNILDNEYNILCRCCINWSNKCLTRNKYSNTEKDSNLQKHKVAVTDDFKGEITQTTIYGIQTINITQTQNEGRQIIHLKSLSSMDDSNELKTKGEYEMNAVKHASYYIDHSKTQKSATINPENISNILSTPQ